MKNKRLMTVICCFSLCAASLAMASGCDRPQGSEKETGAVQETQSMETASKQESNTETAETSAVHNEPEAAETSAVHNEPETAETSAVYNEPETEMQQQKTEQPAAEATEAGTKLTEVQQELMLYITLGNGEFQKYPYICEGDKEIPAGLIQGIADITGWNLTLADEVYSGKGGISVIFSSEASIFTGPPENQVEEFHVYDSEQLTYAILDSVQKTLQNYASAVNPDSVDIWYAMEDGQPLTIDSLGVTLPIEQPYSHEELSELLGNSTN